MITTITSKNFWDKIAGHPTEDSYNYYQDYFKKIMTVADGVTRDPKEILPDTSKLFGKLAFAFNYPNPSPAKIVADMFTRDFINYARFFIEDPSQATILTDLVRDSFEKCNNSSILRHNLTNFRSPDYVTKDLAGCVAAGAIRINGKVNWGFISDCGAAIFNEKGDLTFKTEDEGPAKHDEYIWQDKRLKNLDWKNPNARRIIRRDYRNNSNQPYSFGVLTGERNAMPYIKTGIEEIKPNDFLVLYTDGLEPVLHLGQFSDNLRKKDFRRLKRLCDKNVQTEGTLVVNFD